MSETKHTPGPWSIDPWTRYDDDANEVPPTHAGHVRAADGSSVCGTCDGCNIIKIEDARLIAAAPDLLAACVEALDNSHGLDSGIYGRLQAAIAKARGQS